MNKNIIIWVALILLSIGIFVGVKIYLDKNLDKQKEELNNTIEKYGTVEKETVEVSIAKFNTEVMDNNIGDPASYDYMVEDNSLYWFGLFDSVNLYVKSENYTGNKDKDITDMIVIQYSDNENIALSRDKILNNVWNYDYYGDSRTIDSHIKKIRHKLGKKGKYIETIRGIGYKFEIKK